MKINYRYLILSLFLVVLFLGFDVDARSRKEIKVMGGVPIEGMNITMDASYDPRLDNLVPGYKVISAVIINESFNIILLSPSNDKWHVRLKGSRRKVGVVHDLRSADPKVWSRLPDGLKRKLGYPLFIPIGAKQVIDLFVPDKISVEKFTNVVIEIESFGNVIDLKSRS
jgi:hypothetical protein